MYTHRLKNLLTIKSILRLAVLFIISIHQGVLKPLLGSHARCKFDPSCSAYVNKAFNLHSPFKAFKLSLSRLFKCHPLTKSYGYDPVPGEIK